MRSLSNYRSPHLEFRQISYFPPIPTCALRSPKQLSSELFLLASNPRTSAIGSQIHVHVPFNQFKCRDVLNQVCQRSHDHRKRGQYDLCFICFTNHPTSLLVNFGNLDHSHPGQSPYPLHTCRPERLQCWDLRDKM